MDFNILSSLFIQRAEKFSALAERKQNKYNLIAAGRIAAALAFVMSVVLCVYDLFFIISILAAAISLILFFVLISIHRKLGREIHYCESLAFINKNEENCLNGKTSGNNEGSQFIEPSHPYTSDLDVFGKSSLYQYTCRAGTSGGRNVLASWLAEGAASDEILQRQEALREITSELDWRQDLQALTLGWDAAGQGNKKHIKKENIQDLTAWLDETAIISNKVWLVPSMFILQAVALALLIASFVGFPLKYFVVAAILNAFVSSSFAKAIASRRDKTSDHMRYLKGYASLLGAIEKKEFASVRLKQLKDMIHTSAVPASKQIEKLSSLLYNLDATRNPYFYPIGNFIFLWDIFWSWRLEGWKEQNRSKVGLWFEAVYEVEALSSLAAMAYLNPEWHYPLISPAAFALNTSSMAHPLIDRKKRVENAIEIDGIGKTFVITGSNMSGKSTFLRTLGVNAVLALTGAPVCAARFEISVMQLYTSMRTHDSLEENTSSFYAELKRLRGLLDILESGTQQPVMYLLDEILKGTNSIDRHKGAKALIRQLGHCNASGFISTHDLELGKVAEARPEQVSNYSFNSFFEEGRLFFDYKLTRGICNSFNAAELMRQIGIKINDFAD